MKGARVIEFKLKLNHAFQQSAKSKCELRG